MNAVTQEDIGMFQDMFSKLSNILVKASDLGAKIPELESQLSALSAESESVRKRNMELDEQLATVRSQRDEAQRNENNIRFELSQVKEAHEVTAASLHSLQTDYNVLRESFNQAKSERDDYGFKNMELQDKLDAANAVITKFKDLLGSISGPSVPEPVVLPPFVEPAQSATPITPPATVDEPSLISEAPKTKRLYRYSDDNTAYEYEYYTNNRTRFWDNEKHEYYVEVAA